MPGRKYGPGGKWIHDRAHEIMKNTVPEYGPEKGKEVAYAIATLQAHRLHKTPKRGEGPGGHYGTPQARKKAKRLYDKPLSEYKKKAAELEKVGSQAERVNNVFRQLIKEWQHVPD